MVSLMNHLLRQLFYDDEGITTAYETEYDVQSSEDACIDDDDDDADEYFLVDEENEIVEPDVDVHLFGISMELLFENIGVTNLIPDDVLEGEDVDVINVDGFDSEPDNDDEINYKRRRLAELSREMKGVINDSSQWNRRNLKLYKNESVRIRARCYRKVHVFTMSQGTGPTGPYRGMKVGPSGSSGPTTRSKKRKNIGTNDDSQASSSVLDAHDKGDLCHRVLEIKHCTYKFLSEKISMSKAFRAKAKAKRDIRGDHVLQYSMLRDYVIELQYTNPNTTAKIAVERNIDPSLPTRMFQRLYVCLGALKLDFKACIRDLLGLDGAFRKGTFPSQVWVAIRLDSNNGIYLLAYALVEAESKSSWCWFLQCLGGDIDLHPNSNFTFISDRQKGIVPTIKTVYLSAEHRYCLRHIHESIKQGWCGQAYKDLLWRAASATNVKDFEKCKAKSDLLLNNIYGVFNGKIVGGRDKSMITLLEYIKEKWELTEIPCKHAVAACWNMAMNDSKTPPSKGWVHPCYWPTKEEEKEVQHEDEPFAKDGGNNAEVSSSAYRQAQQTEPAVGQDGLSGSGVGVVIGLSTGQGGVGGPGGASFAS
ncbi:heat stress transcription factor B-4-like protein [Tanacetum coccineum]